MKKRGLGIVDSPRGFEFVPKTIEVFVAGDRVCQNFSGKVDLTEYPNLEKIVIGSYCFSDVEKCVIGKLPKLKSIRIGGNSFTQHANADIPSEFRESAFTVYDTPVLESIVIDCYSFNDFSHFTLEDAPVLDSIQIGRIGYESSNFMNCDLQLCGCRAPLP